MALQLQVDQCHIFLLPINEISYEMSLLSEGVHRHRNCFNEILIDSVVEYSIPVFMGNADQMRNLIFELFSEAIDASDEACAINMFARNYSYRSKAP
jgi:hypothetical protein